MLKRPMKGSFNSYLAAYHPILFFWRSLSDISPLHRLQLMLGSRILRLVPCRGYDLLLTYVDVSFEVLHPHIALTIVLSPGASMLHILFARPL